MPWEADEMASSVAASCWCTLLSRLTTSLLRLSSLWLQLCSAACTTTGLSRRKCGTRSARPPCTAVTGTCLVLGSQIREARFQSCLAVECSLQCRLYPPLCSLCCGVGRRSRLLERGIHLLLGPLLQLLVLGLQARHLLTEVILLLSAGMVSADHFQGTL